MFDNLCLAQFGEFAGKYGGGEGDCCRRLLKIMSLETALLQARELVDKFDRLNFDLPQINSLSLFDLGHGDLGGYVASFDFTETLQSSDDYEYWFEAADTFPRTARDKDAATAIQKAIAKCEAELEAYAKKHYRRSNPLAA